MKNTNCTNSQQCSFQIKPSEIQSKCSGIDNSQANSFYFTYDCFSEYISVTELIKITRTEMAYVCVFIDILSMIILLVACIVIYKKSNQRKIEYRSENVLISNYTLTIHNIEFHSKNKEKEISDLIKHFRSVMDSELNLERTGGEDIVSPQLINPTRDIAKSSNNMIINNPIIYDINYPSFSTSILDNMIKMNRLRTKYTAALANNKKEESDKLEKKYNLLEEKIKNEHVSGDLKTFNEIYLTMRNHKMTEFYYKLYKRNKAERCCLICCCQKKKIKHLYYKNKWLDVNIAENEPSNIKWENVAYSPFKRCCRKFLVIILSFIIIIASFGVIIGSKAAQQTLSDSYNTSTDCTQYNITDTLLQNEINNKNLTSNQRVYQYCFCQDKYQVNGYQFVSDINFGSETICKDWLDLYIKTTAINAAIVIIVPIINSLLFIMLKLLTSFERNKDLTSDMMSNFIKIMIMQSINTGLIILLVNLRSTTVREEIPKFPILTGNFKDLDPQWYLNVGTTIILYMIINIITPHIAAIFSKIFKECKLCCCKNNKIGITKQEYLKSNMGEDFFIEGRYAQLATTLFVALLYSSGMPILYLMIFGFILITILVDKFLVLRYYRLPKQFDVYITKVFINIVLICIVFHLLMGIWIYGNPYLLIDKSSSTLDSLGSYFSSFVSVKDDSYINQIAYRFSTKQNAVMLIFLILLVLGLIIKFIFSNLVLSMSSCCNQKSVMNLDRKSTLIQTIKDADIGEAMSLDMIDRCYLIRKARYMLYRKKEAIKSESDYLNGYYKRNLRYEREVISYKIRTLSDEKAVSFKLLSENFDTNLSACVKGIKTFDDCLFKTDFSYNILVSDYNYYLINSSVMIMNPCL